VYLQLQKPQKNFADELVSLERPNVCTHFGWIEGLLRLACLDGRFWEFTSDMAKGDTAYTNLALGAHTDNTSFVRFYLIQKREVTGFWFDLFQTDPCGLQLFHLLSHTDGSGGTTLLVDGFYVASILKELHPESYDLLCRIPVPAHSAGEPADLYSPSPPSGYPVLGHDPITGEITQVRWNNDDRSVMNRLQPDLVEKWCSYGSFIFVLKIK
jgi:trimethyllysine dioxygenase